MKILIPNSSSSKNVGDQAMLEAVLGLLSKFGNEVVVHTYHPEFMVGVQAARVDQTVYSWAVFENRMTLVRLSRLLQLLMNFVLIKIGLRKFLFGQSARLIRDYLSADVVVFAPGGYFRSKPGITQSLNLIMMLVMFWFADFTKAKKVVAPISFGPFAYKWQAKLSARALKNCSLIMAREGHSYRELLALHVKHVVQTTDIAFLHYQPFENKAGSATSVVGFTIRNWMDGQAQAGLERAYVEALSHFAKDEGVAIQPIVQVDAPDYKDLDNSISTKIAQQLHEVGVEVLNPIIIRSVPHAIEVYKRIDMLVGMRMHSNILAATQGVPFVAISYEHKTEGICDDLGVSEYSLRCEAVTGSLLLNKMQSLWKQRQSVVTQMVQAQVKNTSQLLNIWEQEFKNGN